MGSPTIFGMRQRQAQLDQFAPLLRMLPEGYYAVRRDDVPDQIDFLRVTFPKSGDHKDTIKVQSQHADQLRLEMSIRLAPPVGKVFSRTTWIRDVRYVDQLLKILTQTNESARLYARKKVRCCMCGTKLTDARSRWYGIGPECEKEHSDYIEEVIADRGEYYPGAEEDEDNV